MNSYYVYILRCEDGSLYTGVTNNVEARLEQHQQGADPLCYTYDKRPIELIWVQAFTSVHDAIHCEKQLKGWRRDKKEALIRGDVQILRELSKRKARVSH